MRKYNNYVCIDFTSTFLTLKQNFLSLAGAAGVSSLLDKAKELSAAGEAQAGAAASAPPKSGKMSGFMKKLKNITGFSDDPIKGELT